ncbi:MAG: hypothetical protein JRI72_03350 [Deltaproteobacteria bacterium]|nr:hypothetical protein [Deltaproteobacteria bacterium]
MKSMEIEGLILRKNDREEVAVESLSIPVMTLKKLMDDGYDHLRVYEENGTVSVWGKACSSCFTEEQLRAKQ